MEGVVCGVETGEGGGEISTGGGVVEVRVVDNDGSNVLVTNW